ncbi:MAG: cyclopentanol dehydrogenase, partial [SAR202 cluster bacterium Io17-Chloro-G4]
MRLEGKVAFISGGGRGMGAVEARMFAAEGACVSIGDVLEDESRKVVEQINEAGGRAIFLPLDVTSEAQWNSAVAATVSEFGKLDIL